MRALSLVLAAAGTVLALSGRAGGSPEEDKARARHEFDAGVEADRHHDWAGALDHYLTANDLLEHPFTIFNIATDYEHLGKLREAGVWYRRYLDKATDPNDLAKVRAQLAELETRPGLLTIRSTPSGARAFVDDKLAGVTPVTLSVGGGVHRIVIESNGQRSQREARLTYGEPQALTITLGAEPGTLGAAGAQPGTLLVFGTPAGATIYVDGQPSGTLPSAQVPVADGSHEVRVVEAGYATFQESAMVPPGGFAKVPVSLQRGGDSDAATTPGTPGTPAGGLSAGYYFAGGAGADLQNGGVSATGELGVTLGHLDLGVAYGKADAGTLASLVVRYVLSSARVAPFIGAAAVLAPGKGAGAFAGARIGFVRSPLASIALLAQIGVDAFGPPSDADLEGSGAPTGTQYAFPLSLSLVGTFGIRRPTQGPP